MIIMLMVVGGILAGFSPLLWKYPAGKALLCVALPLLGLVVAVLTARRVVGYMLAPTRSGSYQPTRLR